MSCAFSSSPLFRLKLHVPHAGHFNLVNIHENHENIVEKQFLYVCVSVSNLLCNTIKITNIIYLHIQIYI